MAAETLDITLRQCLTARESRGGATTAVPRCAALSADADADWPHDAVRGESAPWLRPAAERLRDLSALPPAWDSYGAPPIDPSCIGAVLPLLSMIMRTDTPVPSLVPTSRGSIQVEWHTRGIDLEVEFLTPSRLEISFDDSRTGDSWDIVTTGNLRKLYEAVLMLSRE